MFSFTSRDIIDRGIGNYPNENNNNYYYHNYNCRKYQEIKINSNV